MRTTVHTDIGYATRADIFVRGKNLSDDILPSADFVDMFSLCLWGEYPSLAMKRMLNLLLVTLVDHGLTPSTISSRLTLLGAPESIQGSVVAGLLGVGDRYVGAIQNAAQMLTQESDGLSTDASQDDYDARARQVLERYFAARKKIAGIGHPIHTDGDPRVKTIRSVARESGYYRSAWRLLDAIGSVSRTEFGKPFPVNAGGAMGACIADMGLDPKIGRGLALVGRTAGLVAHAMEEASDPQAPDIWKVVLDAERKPDNIKD